MTRTLSATLRQARKLMLPAKRLKATRSLQQAMTGLIVASSVAPIATLTGKPRTEAAAKGGRRLGVVLQELRAVQARNPAAAAKAPEASVPRTAVGARFLTRTHRTTAGLRVYRLFLPERPPVGLILMLHGCNQTPDDFALGTHMNVLAERHGLAVAYPAQTGGHNAADCWNWFNPANQARGHGEPAILASLARKLTREFGLTRDAVFVAGLSAGGAMAAILADVYPDVFSAAGVHSGLARGSARTVLSAMSAMRSGGATGGIAPARTSHPVRRIVFHGDADDTVHPSNAAQIVAAALGDDAVVTRVTTRSAQRRGFTRSDYARPDGTVQLELWMLNGAGHAWSGGQAAGSYTDRTGPDASAQMIRFFLANAD